MNAQRMLVLRTETAACCITAADLVAIDRDGKDARIAVEGEPCDLADFVPWTRTTADSATPALRMIVEHGGKRRAIRARGDVQLVETPALYRLPRLVRDAGVAPWLVGLVLLAQPTPWIDLTRIAQELS